MSREEARRIRMAERSRLLGEDLEAFRRGDSPTKTENGERTAAKRFRAIERDQMVIRPVDVEKLVEADHKVRAIWAMVSQLDMSRMEAEIKAVEGGKGRSAYDPRLLSAIWIYGYSEGINSARELARMCSYEPALQWLTGLEEVNYHTLADFRTANKAAQDDIFTQVLGLLSAGGLTDVKRVMQDGTKIKAQAAAGSFRREEAIREHLKLAQEQIQSMGDPKSEDLSQRVRKARERGIREYQQRLEQALRELAELKKQRADPDKARVSESDPEARVMKQSDGGFAPSYNVQICTEASNKIILAVETTQARTDYDELMHGIDAVHANTGQTPKQMVVDGGYIKNANIEEAAERGVDLIGPVAESNPEGPLKKRGISPDFYPDKFRFDQQSNTLICPAEKTLTFQRSDRREGGSEHSYRANAADCENCPLRSQCCPQKSPRAVTRKEYSETVKAFRAKMETEEAQQIYRTRAEIAETPNAWIKAKFGVRQFRLRGLLKVGLEAIWACLTYNIMQWRRLIWKPQLRRAAAGVVYP
jgi:transposase